MYVYIHMCLHMYVYLCMYVYVVSSYVHSLFPHDPEPQWEGGRGRLPPLRLCCTLHCTRTQCATYDIFSVLFCSPASALCCPGRITSLHNLPPAWHGRTSSKNFHLIAAKNGKNKLKEKENNKIKICRWLLFTILLRLCHERRWGMSTATDSDVDCDCDACYALCGYVMRGPPSPQMAFQLPLHALPCLELDRHMHLP